MKLTNHKKENSYTAFGSVMRGTIEMSSSEYVEALMFLNSIYSSAVKGCDTYVRDSLSFMQHFKGKVYEVPRDPVSFGICGTKLIVSHFGLGNYKDINYGVTVTK